MLGYHCHSLTRREALNLEDEADTKCSAPFRAPELYQVLTSTITTVLLSHPLAYFFSRCRRTSYWAAGSIFGPWAAQCTAWHLAGHLLKTPGGMLSLCYVSEELIWSADDISPASSFTVHTTVYICLMLGKGC